MFRMTRCVVSSVFGGDRGDGALIGLPLIPAVAVGEMCRAAVSGIISGVAFLRRKAAKVLRQAAEQLDPAPVASRLDVRLARLSLPLVAAPTTTLSKACITPSEREEVPPVLVMPSAAQETVDHDYRGLVESYGSIAKAAKAIGIPSSTFRGRLKKQG